MPQQFHLFDSFFREHRLDVESLDLHERADFLFIVKAVACVCIELVGNGTWLGWCRHFSHARHVEWRALAYYLGGSPAEARRAFVPAILSPLIALDLAG